ncbi:MAG TPA: hypothetical protein VJN67_19285 [Stellaceae bacterium]|nr:hypothetical protein [Stellaceae bacterium]
MPPGKTPATPLPASKSAKAQPGASRIAAGKAKAGGPARKAIAPGKRKSTPGGLLTIAILGGLAIGLVAMVIYGIVGPKSEWAFDRPEAQLPSLQSKHTLQ